MDVVTANQLIAAYPGIERDLAEIYVLAGGEEPPMQQSQEPMKKFAAPAQRLLDGYMKSTLDRRRSNVIAGILRKGNKPWPIFVDQQGIIRKGRHRVVTFFVMDFPTIGVVNVKLRPPTGE